MARRPEVLDAPLGALSLLDEVPLFGDGTAAKRRRFRTILSVGAAGMALVMVCGGIYVMTQRNTTTTVTLGDAVARFRSVETEAVDAPKAEQATAPEVIADAPALADTPAVGSVDGPKAAQVAVSAAPQPYVLPPEGVYTYKTRGWETVSMFGARHEYPERNAATVRHLGACRWEHRNEVLEEHVDTRHFCAAGGAIAQVFYGKEITFFGKKDGGAMTCEPPIVLHKVGLKRGDQILTHCADEKGGEASMTRTFVGTEAMRIAGEQTEAVKITIDAKMSGSMEGKSFDALWLHPVTGMTLRWERSVDTLAPAFGAKVRYQEDATFVLESLNPQT